MDEHGSRRRSRTRQVANRHGIGAKRVDGLILGSVDRIVRGAVDDRVWCRGTERRLHRLGVIDVQIGVTKGHDLVIAAKLMDDGRAELTAGAYDDDAHVMVEALMRRWPGRTRQSR